MVDKRVWRAAIAVATAGTACSAEGIAERVVENRLEAESGQDVDIDFDDGDVRLQTDDGEFTIETDDDGNLSIQGEGGSGDESFTIDSENGETIVETEDGTATLSQSGNLPDGFPSDVTLPSPSEVLFSQTFDTPEGQAATIGGTSTLTPADFAGELEKTLVDAGYGEEQRASPDGGNELLVYRDDELRVQAVVVPGDEGSGFQISVQPVTD